MSSYLPPQGDEYAGFAERYDRFFEHFDVHEPERLEFFRTLFGRHGVRKVLDCACGTGRDLHLFHQLGFEAQGTDISASMLAQAHKNLASLQGTIALELLDYRDLPLRFGREFDAVVCLATSISHMPDEAQVQRALRSMAAVLRPGGILVLSQGTTDRQWRERPRFLLAFDHPDLTRLFVIDYLDKGARYNIVDLFHGDPTRTTPQVWSTEYVTLLLRDDQERLLRASGFSHVEFYGSLSFEPYDPSQSRYLIAVAKKE